MLVERPRRPIVGVPHARFLGDDDHGAGSAVAHLAAAIGDQRAGPRLFTHERSKHRVERASQPRRISGHRRADVETVDLQADVAILHLLHLPGHFGEEMERVDRLEREGDGSGVHLGDFAELG